jgi:hypothetical protein
MKFARAFLTRVNVSANESREKFFCLTSFVVTFTNESGERSAFEIHPASFSLERVAL